MSMIMETLFCLRLFFVISAMHLQFEAFFTLPMLIALYVVCAYSAR